METEILFEEVQRFTKKSIRNFLKALMGIFFAALIINLILQKGQMTDFSFALMALFGTLLLINIILDSKLVTQIRTDGIYVRFPPWQPFSSKFYWTDIAEVGVRNYNAMREFFGWGLRIQSRRTGYIVAGDTGIEIIFKNGRIVLITTQRADEVNEVLRRIGRL